MLVGQSLKGLNKDYSVLLKYAALSQRLSVNVNSQIDRLISTLVFWFWKQSFWAGQFILITQSYHPLVHYPTKIRARQIFPPQTSISVSFKTKCKIHFNHIPSTRCLTLARPCRQTCTLPSNLVSSKVTCHFKVSYEHAEVFRSAQEKRILLSELGLL